MTEYIQFFDCYGHIISETPKTLPQYKIAFIPGKKQEYAAYELNRDGQYERQIVGPYPRALLHVMDRVRNINSNKFKIGWSRASERDADGDLTTRTYTLGGIETTTDSFVVWTVRYLDSQKWEVCYTPEPGTGVCVYVDRFSGCQLFMQNHVDGIIQRITELFAFGGGLPLYRYIADLALTQQIPLLGEHAIPELVERAINYSPSWTAKAGRIGRRFIKQSGTATNLSVPAGCVDWNVTQLTLLYRLSNGEIAWLVSKGHISPTMTGDELKEFIKAYTKDPEHLLYREYLFDTLGNPE